MANPLKEIEDMLTKAIRNGIAQHVLEMNTSDSQKIPVSNVTSEEVLYCDDSGKMSKGLPTSRNEKKECNLDTEKASTPHHASECKSVVTTCLSASHASDSMKVSSRKQTKVKEESVMINTPPARNILGFKKNTVTSQMNNSTVRSGGVAPYSRKSANQDVQDTEVIFIKHTRRAPNSDRIVLIAQGDGQNNDAAKTTRTDAGCTNAKIVSQEACSNPGSSLKKVSYSSFIHGYQIASFLKKASQRLRCKCH